ncbi:16S rRNA (cytidine(1402)-2'-O)-methyltransferase [Saccharobesus litoralis]|uniref:Ribosomal RNA small subunit methyltransferase I n=1 Tax=Saccharobesus litoralis TaxID=2172099 RepID=A0A2S0VQ11_9ALTE|nr:16S rRNA (cytidine(1402)-2'-O)-methyltransferase [Saccharobesus litoralis]AWB66283.1 16S rRNA (cytidine(1402)-2'-O)-methyltransferase [Saccharobesus litoralis]
MADIGTLYVVATPIGNLGDITARAIQTLSDVDYVAAEDTRVAKKLFSQFEIKTPLIAYHDHNETEQSDKLIYRLKQGENLALISDAGTPLINDPGYVIVKACREHNIKVVPIPGASAVVTALCAAGVATDQFYYGGFLPAKSKARCDVLATLVERDYCSVYYESTHRILASLDDMQKVLGDERHIVIARELTKTFETIKAGAVSDVIAWIKADHNQQKGEFVVIVEGVKQAAQMDDKAKNLLKTLQQHLPPKTAAGIVADTFGLKKKDVYQYGLGLE